MQDTDTNDTSDEEDWRLPPELPALPQELPALSNKNKQTGEMYQSGASHLRTIIHIDMDCFYAQVEMIRNPQLRDKPIGVQQKSLLATTNYKARELGVKKMMSLREAKAICPQIILVNGEDLTHYRDMSYKISDLCLKFSSKVERLGFDENFLDVTDIVSERMCKLQLCDGVTGFTYATQEEDLEHPGHQDLELPDSCHCGCDVRLRIGSHIAADIRHALYDELGLTCCAGIAHNKLLSKLVAGQHKPNQQTTLFPGQTGRLLASLSKPGDIPGIGHATCKKLSSLGIQSLADLQNASVESLTEELGETMTTTIKHLACGIDDSPVVPFGLPQMLSDEDSFRKCSSLSAVHQKIEELLQSLLNRLLMDGRIPRTLRLTIRKGDGRQYAGRESRQCPISSDLFTRFNIECINQVLAGLTAIAVNLFHKLVNVKEPFNIVLMNVAFTKMEPRAKNAISSFFRVQKQAQSIPLQIDDGDIQRSNKCVSRNQGHDGHLPNKCASRNQCPDGHNQNKYVSKNQAHDGHLPNKCVSRSRSPDGHNQNKYVSRNQAHDGHLPNKCVSRIHSDDFRCQNECVSKTPVDFNTNDNLLNVKNMLNPDTTSTPMTYTPNIPNAMITTKSDSCNHLKLTLIPSTQSKSEIVNYSGIKRKVKSSVNSDSFFAKKQRRLVPGRSNLNTDGFEQSQSSYTTKNIDKVLLPMGVDPDVFLQLPSELQQEVVQDLFKGSTERRYRYSTELSYETDSLLNDSLVNDLNQSHEKSSSEVCDLNSDVSRQTNRCLSPRVSNGKASCVKSTSIRDSEEYMIPEKRDRSTIDDKHTHEERETKEQSNKCVEANSLIDRRCADACSPESGKKAEIEIISRNTPGHESHVGNLGTSMEVGTIIGDVRNTGRFVASVDSKLEILSRNTPGQESRVNNLCTSIADCDSLLEISGRDPPMHVNNTGHPGAGVESEIKILSRNNASQERCVGNLGTSNSVVDGDSLLEISRNPPGDVHNTRRSVPSLDSELEIFSRNTPGQAHCVGNFGTSMVDGDSLLEISRDPPGDIHNTRRSVPSLDSELEILSTEKTLIKTNSGISAISVEDSDCVDEKQKCGQSSSSEFNCTNISPLKKSERNSLKRECSVIPPGVDPDVFRSLPASMQRELSLEWEMKSMRSSPKTGSGVKLHPKLKSNPNDTILKFFRLSNKSVNK